FILLFMDVTAEYVGQQPSAGPFRSAIARVSLADGAVKMLRVFAGGNFNRFDLSPDGQTIAYSARISRDTPQTDRSIYVMTADGSGDAEIVNTGSNTSPTWAPDGTHLLFISDRSGSPGLYSIEVQKGQANGVPHLLRKDIGYVNPIGVTRSGTYY